MPTASGSLNMPGIVVESRRMRRIAFIALLASAACLPKSKIHQRAIDEVYKGYDYLKAEDLERADVACNHALEFNNDFPEAWNCLGVIELRRGNVEGAKQH